MSFIITSDCIKCGACVEVCPENAIVEDVTQYIITDDCIECELCLKECHLDAIKGNNNKK
ncbi:MAG: 4Fe-4S ferredoxin [Candidatus Cloacimonas sp. 4484_140]|nr:MAG: 4Fe-4S ferredoxin [Candidatus Cloacimonas sp. 4484_140]HHI87770.1 4Fe-4S dicluster domain-containing protein [Candidatus Cloacimonadota bacterium]